jgi:hypothetical protein
MRGEKFLRGQLDAGLQWRHLEHQWGIGDDWRDDRGVMKTKSYLLPLAVLSLMLSSCVSAGLAFRDSFTGRVTTGERVTAAAVDLVTLPVQIPALAVMAAK